MPNERMPDDFHAVFFTEFDEAIGLSEIKFTFPGLQIHAFHGIFSNDRIKMLFDNLNGLRVCFSELRCGEGGADKEFILESLLEGDRVFLTGRKLCICKAGQYT